MEMMDDVSIPGPTARCYSMRKYEEYDKTA